MLFPRLFGVRVRLRAWPESATAFEMTEGHVEHVSCLIRRRIVPAVGEILQHPDLMRLNGFPVARVTHHWGRNASQDVSVDVFVESGILAILKRQSNPRMYQEKWDLYAQGPVV